MKRSLWGICLLTLMAWAAPEAPAQQHNVGYYVKVAEGPDWTTFERTHSLYAPNAYNESVRPGDILLSPPTGECPPNSPVACITGHQDTDRDQGGKHSIQSDGPIKDRITIVGRRIVYNTVSVIVRSFALTPDSLTILRGTSEQVDSEPEAEACTAQKIGDMGGLLTPAQQQLIADFLNSPAAENLWQSSGFQGPHVYGNRQEQAGWLFGSGNFMGATWNSGPNECGGNIAIPSSLPPGTIFVHTHPASAANSEYVCSIQYMNEPGGSDVQTLITAGPNVTIGLIIDADGIIVFTQDYSGEDPNAAHFKGGEDGKCGFERF